MLGQLAACALVAFILGPGGCGLFVGWSSGPADVYSVRIILRESIDSLMTGFSPEQVRLREGDPADVARGDYAGFNYRYGPGSGSALTKPEIEILFAEDFDSRAAWITVNPPFDGRTVQGIGIGSARWMVRSRLGPADADTVRTEWGRLPPGYFVGDAYLSGDTVAMIFQYDRYGKVNRIDLARLKFH